MENMDNPSEDTIQFHEDEEILEVIDLSDTEQTPGESTHWVSCAGANINNFLPTSYNGDD